MVHQLVSHVACGCDRLLLHYSTLDSHSGFFFYLDIGPCFLLRASFSHLRASFFTWEFPFFVFNCQTRKRMLPAAPVFLLLFVWIVEDKAQEFCQLEADVGTCGWYLFSSFNCRRCYWSPSSNCWGHCWCYFRDELMVRITSFTSTFIPSQFSQSVSGSLSSWFRALLQCQYFTFTKGGRGSDNGCRRSSSISAYVLHWRLQCYFWKILT